MTALTSARGASQVRRITIAVAKVAMRPTTPCILGQAPAISPRHCQGRANRSVPNRDSRRRTFRRGAEAERAEPVRKRPHQRSSGRFAPRGAWPTRGRAWRDELDEPHSTSGDLSPLKFENQASSTWHGVHQTCSRPRIPSQAPLNHPTDYERRMVGPAGLEPATRPL